MLYHRGRIYICYPMLSHGSDYIPIATTHTCAMIAACANIELCGSCLLNSTTSTLQEYNMSGPQWQQLCAHHLRTACE